MTTYLLGAMTILVAQAYGPKLHAAFDRWHRRQARKTKTRGLPLHPDVEARISQLDHDQQWHQWMTATWGHDDDDDTAVMPVVRRHLYGEEAA